MDLATEARREIARRLLEQRLAAEDPVYLMSHMVGVDQRDGERFDLSHLRAPLEPGEVLLEEDTVVPRDKTWRWQRFVAEKVRDRNRLIFLKGRQIGVTWIVLALDVAEAVLKPGTTSLLFRQREEEAIDNVRRWWTLYQSLPAHFREGIRVLRPDRGVLPGRDGVALLFPSGEISEAVPMSSAAASGHGRSVRHVMADEAAYIEKLEQIMAAVAPAAGRARISIISTANGRSNPETGEGNEFHRRWCDEDSGYLRLFLPYDVHPERDAAWYERAEEVRELKQHQRHAQYPRTPDEAFALSSRVYFDTDALERYKSRIQKPLYRFDWDTVGTRQARKRRSEDGKILVYREPEHDHGYAIGCDVATGRGMDYSAAVVVDLATMEIAAQFRGKIDADKYAELLHYLGRWYGTALLAVETQGGYGEAVIIPLRDGRAGRPPYPKLYQHTLQARPDMPIAKPYGWPTNLKTRPTMLSQLEKAVRDDLLPYVTSTLLHEMGSFVHHDSGTSPRAEEGSHDDVLMATAIALEMYRQRGHHPNRPRRKPKPSPPRPFGVKTR